VPRQQDTGADLHRQEQRKGDEREPFTDGAQHVGSLRGRQHAAHGRKNNQRDGQLTADPDDRPQHMHEPQHGPDIDHRFTP
jgi:hypothetical protein